MVMSAMSEPDIAVKLNPNGEVKVVKFKPKFGSVIPPKRRSVKRMMFDYFVRLRRPPSSSAATQSDKANSCFKKSKPIYPQTP